MTAHAGRLGRIIAFRRLAEQLRNGELAEALAAAAASARAMQLQSRFLDQGREATISALLAGDQAEWQMAEAQTEVARWNHRHLEVMHAEHEQMVDTARERLLESRLESEQAELLRRELLARQAAEQERMAQALSDEDYLLRLSRRQRSPIKHR